MTARTNLGEAQPGLYQAALRMSREADAAAGDAGLPRLTVELVKIRVSQLNGCAFCLRHHTRDALAEGETSERLAVLPAWRETTYFDAIDRAALELAESVTAIGSPGRSDSYATVADTLTAAQLAAVAWVAIATNTLNRLSITSGYRVGPS